MESTGAEWATHDDDVEKHGFSGPLSIDEYFFVADV